MLIQTQLEVHAHHGEVLTGVSQHDLEPTDTGPESHHLG